MIKFIMSKAEFIHFLIKSGLMFDVSLTMIGLTKIKNYCCINVWGGLRFCKWPQNRTCLSQFYTLTTTKKESTKATYYTTNAL